MCPHVVHMLYASHSILDYWNEGMHTYICIHQSNFDVIHALDIVQVACWLTHIVHLQDDMTPVGQTPPYPSPTMPTPRASPWPALQLALGRAVYYLGFLALPSILFWVGLSCQDLLHGSYLALLVVWFLGHSLALEPRVSMGPIGNNQVCLSMRCSYA